MMVFLEDERQSKEWPLKPPRLDGTFEVALPLGGTEEEGLEGTDNHLQEPSLALWFLTGMGAPC